MATYQTTSNVATSGDTVIDALTYDTKWGGAFGTGATLTYSFHNAASTYGTQATYGTADPFSNATAPNEVLKTAVRASLAEWSKVANLTFVEVADTGSTSGVLRFGTSSEIDRLGIAGRATTPSTTFERSGDVWLSNKIYSGVTALSPGNYYFQAVMHEIGHALGMSHPFDTGVKLPKDQDSDQFTVMSYTREPSYIGIGPDDGREGSMTASTPMLYDIKAIQYLYGANAAAATGNDTYVFDPANVQFKSVWDAGGTDTFDASRHTGAVTRNLNPGSFSTISTPFKNGAWTVDGAQYTQALDNVSIAYGTTIENAVGGSGNDTITGNAVSNTLTGNAGADRLYGFDGDDYLIGGQGDDTLDGGNGFDIAMFDDSPNAVTVDLSSGYAVSAWGGRDTLVSVEGAAGTGGNDVFIGTGTNNHFFGGDGDDTVAYNGGSDWFDGGAGRDTVTGFGLRHEYSAFSFDGGNGTVGGQGTGNVEKFVFADGTLVTDTASSAAQVFRLYGATLDRAPDLGGLRSWTNAVENKALTLAQATDGFTGSAEFQGKYGALDNAGFVKLLYNNVLDREADAGGLNAWVGGFNGGLSRSQVVLGFSESAENIAKTSSDVLKGLWIGDDRAAQVARMYDTTLDRQGDAPGIKGWLGALKGGVSLKTMADGFTSSAEFQGKYGALDDVSFVRQLYRNVLDRDGEESGVQAWHGGLKGGMTRSDIVVGFSESAEHQVKLAGLTDDGIHFV